MPKKRKPAKIGPTAQSGHLILKVDRDTFYFVPTDRLGPPLALTAEQKAQLNKWIGSLDGPVIGLEFAMLVDSGEAAIRIARNG